MRFFVPILATGNALVYERSCGGEKNQNKTTKPNKKQSKPDLTLVRVTKMSARKPGDLLVFCSVMLGGGRTKQNECTGFDAATAIEHCWRCTTICMVDYRTIKAFHGEVTRIDWRS